MISIVERLAPHLDGAARSRLDQLVAEITAAPHQISVKFPAVARLVARGPGSQSDPDGLRVPRLEDEARVALLVAAARSPRWQREQVTNEVLTLYRHGDADEKRAVLRALDELDLGDAGLPLVADALRTNDIRLIAAALGRYGCGRLDTHSWRQGVLKCLFVGVPLDAISGLSERTDAELVRMVADYVAERQAAGRSVPPDAWLVLDRSTVPVEEP